MSIARRDIAQQAAADTVDCNMDLGALGDGPDAVLPVSGFGRENWGRWRRRELRRAGFAFGPLAYFDVFSFSAAVGLTLVFSYPAHASLGR